MDSLDYNDRYGIRRERGWLPWAIALAVVGGGWLIWAGLSQAEPSVDTTIIAFSVQDPRKIELRYIVNREDSSRVALCTLTARDIDKVIVGQITDEIPASTGAIERVAVIPSRSDAVNAGVDSCRLK